MTEKQNAEMMELLPCPFCGGNAELDRMGNPRQSCIVACIDCGCRLETGLEERNSGRQWNTRTAVPSPHPRGEPVGYVSAATISALGEPEGSGPIVACAAFDTIIPLYAAPPAAGADAVRIGQAGVQTIPLPMWAAEDLLKWMRKTNDREPILYPIGLENLLQALVSALSSSPQPQEKPTGDQT